jgi:hypothetical protein
MMANPPRIVPPSEIEQARAYVTSYDAAARSYAGALSDEQDPEMRERLSAKLEHARAQAEFYRGIITSSSAG